MSQVKGPSAKAAARKAGGGEAGASLVPIAQLLRAHARRIADETADQIVAQIPTYVGVSRNSLVESLLHHNERAANALLAPKEPLRVDVADGSVARERAQAGVPVEDMLQAIRLGFSALRDQVIGWSFSLQLEPQLIIQATQTLWDVNDAVTRGYATLHRQEELEIARTDERHRIEFLRALVFGSISRADLHLHAAAFGVPLDRSYVAFRARPRDGFDRELLSRAIRTWAAATRELIIFAPLEGDLAGISTTPPSIADIGTLGLGEATDLHDVARSFQSASRALDVGVSFGHLGVVSLESLSLQLAVASEHEVGAMMMERYIVPLRAEGQFGDLVCQSVRAYLDAELSVHRGAELLCIHPNTLRHRLRRFEDATGADLASPQCLMEVWWALERQRWERVAPHRNSRLEIGRAQPACAGDPWGESIERAP